MPLVAAKEDCCLAVRAHLIEERNVMIAPAKIEDADRASLHRTGRSIAFESERSG